MGRSSEVVASAPVGAIDQRAAERIMHERRRRLWRRLATIVLGSAVMIVLTMLQRDNQSRRYHMRQMERVADALNARMESRKEPPDLLRVVTREPELMADYLFNPAYLSTATARGKSGVCCYRAPIPLFLQPDGRPVLVFDGQRFTVAWLQEAEFKSQADALGLSLALRPTS